jgi:hypothetical protein
MTSMFTKLDGMKCRIKEITHIRNPLKMQISYSKRDFKFWKEKGK